MTTWRTFAACADPSIPTSTFFPDMDAGHNTDYSAALAICAGCPVQRACLDEHIGERHGCYGGMTPNQRAKLARKESLSCRGCGAVLERTRVQSQRKWCEATDCRRAHSRETTAESRRRRG